jgi:shikimate dehydrogenase
VFLVGTGGPASAIAFAIGRHGGRTLTIHNRTAARAEALAARVRGAWPALDVRAGGADPAGHELIVNATSLGMRPGDPLPVDVARLDRDALAAEVVVAPETTAFLAAAAERGCPVHGGLPMLAAQIEQMIDFMGG